MSLYIDDIDFVRILSEFYSAQSLSLFLNHTSNDIPHTRYLSSIGFLPAGRGRGPEALVFGGDGGLLHNSYTDSYDTFFDDVWLLSPREVFVSSTMMNQRNREEYCDWRSRPDSTAIEIWKNETCGWDPYLMNDTTLPGECSLKDIMIAAWCRGEFQSLTMS